MQPQQTVPPSPQPTPPYGPAPQPGYTPNSQPQPYTQSPQSQPYAPGYGHQATPAQPPYQPSQQPASWYTPTPQPNDYAPASADEYLRQARAQAPAAGGYTSDQYPDGYLDQMAAGNQPRIERKYLIVGGVLGCLLLIAMAIFLFTPKQAPSTQTPARLFSTIVDTQQVTQGAGKLIKNNRLKSINSTLNTSLINAATSLEKPLSTVGEDAKKLRAGVKKSPYHDQKLVDKLEDARLNAVYDRTYVTQIDYKVKDILLNMQSIKKAGTTQAMQDSFGKIEQDLTTVTKSLHDLAKSSSGN